MFYYMADSYLGKVLTPFQSPNRSSPVGVLQFGKTRRKRYALDFRHPVSALQAFGICLSLFNWAV